MEQCILTVKEEKLRYLKEIKVKDAWEELLQEFCRLKGIFYDIVSKDILEGQCIFQIQDQQETLFLVTIFTNRNIILQYEEKFETYRFVQEENKGYWLLFNLEVEDLVVDISYIGKEAAISLHKQQESYLMSIQMQRVSVIDVPDICTFVQNIDITHTGIKTIEKALKETLCYTQQLRECNICISNY